MKNYNIKLNTHFSIFVGLGLFIILTLIPLIINTFIQTKEGALFVLPIWFIIIIFGFVSILIFLMGNAIHISKSEIKALCLSSLIPIVGEAIFEPLAWKLGLWDYMKSSIDINEILYATILNSSFFGAYFSIFGIGYIYCIKHKQDIILLSLLISAIVMGYFFDILGGFSTPILTYFVWITVHSSYFSVLMILIKKQLKRTIPNMI